MADESSNRMPAPGSITWTEIPVLDLKRAQKFYKTVFDWTFTEIPGSAVSATTGEPLESPYVMFAKGDTRGGLIKVDPSHHITAAGTPYDENKGVQTVTVTITSESVDDVLKAVEKAGGSVYAAKMKIPGDNMGHNAYFLDSEKNVMGVWSLR